MGLVLLVGFARQLDSLPKAAVGVGLTALLLVAGAGSVHDATASNETRTLSFHHTHSGEDLTVTFKREGRYDDGELRKLNHFLRDWRTQDETVMDRHLFDILWEVYRDVDAKQPIQIVSAYRSPATNAMLRRRSAHTGVARFSQHMLGHAMDFYIPAVPLEHIRFAGLRLQRGGVGFYPTSGSPFVHLDSGNIRHWPRMSHDQLARVFPDGRTVHVPTDGVPLKGYELARADIEKRGDGDDVAPVGKRNLFARLFGAKSSGVKSNDEDDEGPAESDAKPVQVASAGMVTPAETKGIDNGKTDNRPASAASSTSINLSASRGKLAGALQLASADVQSVQPARKQAGADKPADNGAAPLSMNDLINARGFWGDDPAKPKQATPEQVAAITARRALNWDDPQSTASLPGRQAMAFALPSSSPVDRTETVAASAPIPVRDSRSSSPGVTAKSAQSKDGVVTATTRIAAAETTDTSWMRVMLLAPSASHAMSVTMMGDADLTVMRSYFVKPPAAVAMSFADDPTPGLASDHFAGAATVKLETTSFAAVRAASTR